VTAIDAFRIGSALRELKDEAGVRQRLCGVLLHKKTGWAAAAGECLATVLSPKGIEDGANRFAREVEASFAMADEPSPLPEILIDVVEE
jgi:hypothetical protein